MTQDQVRIFLEQMLIDFTSGRIDLICSRMTLPLVVYTVAGATVLRTEDELKAMVRQYHATVKATNQPYTSVEIVTMETPQPDRVRVTARSHGKNAEGAPLVPTLIRYFLIADGDSFLIEMLEYLEAPLPPEDIQNIVH